MSPPGTRMPQSPTTSDNAPRSKPTTGVPQDNASAATSPKGSSHNGVTIAPRACATSLRSLSAERWPWNSIPFDKKGSTFSAK